MSEPDVVRIWPPSAGRTLDDDDLADLYATGPDPTLRVNFVASLDGAVTLDGYSAGLSGPADKRVFAVLRMRCDALVVAAGTLRHEGYRALRLDERRRAWRRRHGLSEYPRLVVVSRSLDLDPAQAAFADAPVRPLVATVAQAPAGRRAALAGVAEVVSLGEERVEPGLLLATLHGQGFGQLLCEGGPVLFGALAGAGVVDEVCLTVSPLLAGPAAGRIIAGGPAAVQAMTLRHALIADGNLMLRYTRC